MISVKLEEGFLNLKHKFIPVLSWARGLLQSKSVSIRHNYSHRQDTTLKQELSINVCFVHSQSLNNAPCKQKTYFSQLNAAVEIDLGLESHPLPKWPFLTVFSQIYRPTKIYMLGTCGAFCCCFIPDNPWVTPYVAKMASKLTSSYLSRCLHKLTCHLAAALWSFSEVSLV